jgi:GTP-binding protein
MLRTLGEQSLASSGLKFTLQAIITKTDDLPRDSAPDVIPIMQRKIFAAAPTCLPAIITSALLKPPFGIEDVRKSIADACGLLSS